MILLSNLLCKFFNLFEQSRTKNLQLIIKWQECKYGLIGQKTGLAILFRFAPTTILVSYFKSPS
jgi:hypothetical protein